MLGCYKAIRIHMKGFEAKCNARHNKCHYGDVVYMKAVEFKYSTPTLFAILNRSTGVVIDYVTGNEFRNRFTAL